MKNKYVLGETVYYYKSNEYGDSFIPEIIEVKIEEIKLSKTFVIYNEKYHEGSLVKTIEEAKAELISEEKTIFEKKEKKIKNIIPAK